MKLNLADAPLLTAIAEQQLGAGKYIAAESALRRALMCGGGTGIDAQARRALGDALRAQHKLPEALAEYEGVAASADAGVNAADRAAAEEQVSALRAQLGL